jgi:hypothetical protein
MVANLMNSGGSDPVIAPDVPSCNLLNYIDYILCDNKYVLHDATVAGDISSFISMI